MPIVQDDQDGFSGSDSEPTSGHLSQKRKKGQAFPLAISYGGFLPNQYGFLGSDSEPTSGCLTRKRKKGQAFPPAISYGGFLPCEASTSVLADEPMPMMPASLSQAVGSQITLPRVNPPTSRIAPPWGKGDPPISVTGVIPRLLGKT